MALKDILKIRRARPEDARGIHDAHMLSIQSICSKDYSSEEIQAWGYGPFNEASRLNAINNHLVWVIEVNNKIEGYGHFKVYEKDGIKMGHVMGLYFTEIVRGLGLGKKIFEQMIAAAKESHVETIRLQSTLTSHGFYKKMGFKDDGGMTTINFAGTPIRCIPMKMELNVD